MINADKYYDSLINNTKPVLSFDNNINYIDWKKQVHKKFLELMGINEIIKNQVEIKINIEYEKDKGLYKEIRFTFESEKDCIVPCYLLIPNLNKETYPVMICLQGHSTGFHNSIGMPLYKHDKKYIKKGNGDFGIQAVNNGYIAFCIEQRGMGERKTKTERRLAERGCDFFSNNALLLGRTLVGERVWDISKAIDTLSFFKQADLNNIGCIGHSGGGTTSYYAACFDKRIKIVVPSCAVCSFKMSIAKVYHCSCNYIPSMFKYFDMGELACLIAHRKLLIVAGEKDILFYIDGVKEVYSVIEQIYSKENKAENCKLVITSKNHYWHKELIWKNINEMLEENN